MFNRISLLIKLSIGLLFCVRLAIGLPAFPEAMGWGSNTLGGRGGRVIKVTNLEDSGPGSFREACNTPGKRIIVFERGGIIELESPISIEHPYVTIAGQTAPGGITLVGYWIGINTWDVVIRNIRIRRISEETGALGDCIKIYNARNCILDHISVADAIDEAISIVDSTNITIQWSTIEGGSTTGHPEGRPHNKGILIRGNSGNITLHHLLFANNINRHPYVNREEARGDCKVDVINCTIYNYQIGISAAQGNVSFNIIGNYLKPGPCSREHGEVPFYLSGRDCKVYLKDNFHPKYQDWEIPEIRNVTKLGEPFYSPSITTQSVEEAYELVLEYSGAWPRDKVTESTIKQVIEDTGRYGRSTEPLEMPWGDAPKDTDNDGMSDDWEIERGLDPYYLDDSKDSDRDGYTNIEEYLNYLMDKITPRKIEGDEEITVLPNIPNVIAYPNPCYPNKGTPWDRKVKISNIPIDSNPVIHIYNIAGELVRVLEEDNLEIKKLQNSKLAVWNVKDEYGNPVRSGLYIYLLKSDKGEKTGRIAIIR